jgi:hypothetical protein
MSRRFLLILLAYLVPTFALGFVWHLQLFEAYYRELGNYRPDPIIPFGFLSMLIQGVVFAVAYSRFTKTPESIVSGVRFALVAGALSWSFTTLAVAAKQPMTSVPRYITIETSFTLVQFLLVGPLFALSARSRERSASAAVAS